MSVHPVYLHASMRHNFFGLRIKDRADFNICGTEFFVLPFLAKNQFFEVFEAYQVHLW